ncbi:MAG: hypothetical protein Q7U55_06270, partial [Deltaproteobacteria bacterium]|nr:hypothetical protein [Deltaproteobacteria bacterium]
MMKGREKSKEKKQEERNPKFQSPAFAEAASRRQANHQIITKFQSPKFLNLKIFIICNLVIGYYLEFG